MMGLMLAVVMIASAIGIVRDGESPGRVIRDLVDPLSILGAAAGCWMARALWRRFGARGGPPGNVPPEEESCSK